MGALFCDRRRPRLHSSALKVSSVDGWQARTPKVPEERAIYHKVATKGNRKEIRRP